MVVVGTMGAEDTWGCIGAGGGGGLCLLDAFSSSFRIVEL